MNGFSPHLGRIRPGEHMDVLGALQAQLELPLGEAAKNATVLSKGSTQATKDLAQMCLSNPTRPPTHRGNIFNP